ncbi:MAG: type IV secretion protein Rhs [Gilliamella sp.]|uniref:type IV secretion protein Rhs n=1 Tax=unclassified Gilliamella TaxID=2685620 RepID=UPI00158076B3|nr:MULTISPECIES: type IV secretion protein Rhs [unclassified Gilliamella]MCO6540549.1 type IV secretion protein Rhs [Gilliamella sp.]NUE96945.1 type IV secretion protein Rhs [Gilliamella sp. ESL0232]
MTFDDEIKIKLSQLSEPAELIDNWENIAYQLSNSFEWKGTKIDWSKTLKHKSNQLFGSYSNWLFTIKKFIIDNDISAKIRESGDIYYINDSSLNFAVHLKFNQFDSFLAFAVESIPQHHYFFDSLNKWCLVISSEGFIDFGLSLKKSV